MGFDHWDRFSLWLIKFRVDKIGFYDLIVGIGLDPQDSHKGLRISRLCHTHTVEAGG